MADQKYELNKSKMIENKEQGTLIVHVIHVSYEGMTVFSRNVFGITARGNVTFLIHASG